MDTLHVLLLAFLQGFTEFLPISSSGHLILTPWLFGYELQSLAFDVAVHLGTLGAVMLYFRQEILAMLGALWEALRHRRLDSPEARLGILLGLATLPIVVLGLPLKALLDGLRQEEFLLVLVIAATTIGFGLLLGLADWRGRRVRDEFHLTWKGALVIGLFQAIAILPGTSRSGITMTAALFLGLTREAASRFSFLLAIPTILMAGVLATRDLIQSSAPIDGWALVSGALLSFLVAYLTIHFFLRFIERVSMWPFVLYRLLLGGVLLVLVL